MRRDAPAERQALAPGAGSGSLVGWQRLADLVRAEAPLLRAPRAGAGCCVVCRGPARRKGSYCAQCELHAECAQGSLADVVVPVAYAIKGGSYARQLWQYKSAALLGAPGMSAGPLGARGASTAPDSGPGAAAATLLRALLLVFLREHGSCVWRAAAMATPTHVAVVPTGRGRLGPHPLRALIGPYLLSPWAELTARPAAERTRDLDPDRFAAAAIPGARVVLVDDTWTTGASAQSAAMALRRAGARSVATVVLARHVGAEVAERADGPVMPFRPEACAVHGPEHVPCTETAKPPRDRSLDAW